jgi:hypothetical protein
MRKFEKFLKIISLGLGTVIFTFLAWLLLVYKNFNQIPAFVIGGLMVLAVIYCVFRWGYLFLDD